jgi:DNA-binding response OmpR family regulator
MELSRRILIVDDNVDAAEGLALLLKISGHVARTAEDGAEALKAAETFRPEIILLDIGLPHMNGYEVAQRLRDEYSQDLLLVAVTGYSRDEDLVRVREAGFDHLIVKPVSIDKLQTWITSHSMQNQRQ